MTATDGQEDGCIGDASDKLCSSTRAAGETPASYLSFADINFFPGRDPTLLPSHLLAEEYRSTRSTSDGARRSMICGSLSQFAIDSSISKS
jgi:hypothetical protein